MRSAAVVLLSAAFFLGAQATNGTWWKPVPNTSWNYVLSVDPALVLAANSHVQVVGIDLFDSTAATIQGFHQNGQRVICYFSAGSYEDWRPDASEFPAAILGDDLSGWAGEKWLDIRDISSSNSSLKVIMGARMDMAVTKGCDGVDPDNVDGYENETGFPLTSDNQVTYNTWLSESAHARNLAVGLKNDVDQVAQLVDLFDWAINEQCVEYGECDTLVPFITQGKPVFGVEYNGNFPTLCQTPNADNFDTLKKNLSLDIPFEACKNYSFTLTPIVSSNSTTPTISPTSSPSPSVAAAKSPSPSAAAKSPSPSAAAVSPSPTNSTTNSTVPTNSTSDSNPTSHGSAATPSSVAISFASVLLVGIASSLLPHLMLA